MTGDSHSTYGRFSLKSKDNFGYYLVEYPASHSTSRVKTNKRHLGVIGKSLLLQPEPLDLLWYSERKHLVL